jgi:FixJ family two-component response regulator
MKSDKMSVLIIDDEQTIVDQLSFFLTEYGFDVAGLSDSKKALEYINQKTYDIILTDLKMPVISGMDIVKAAKDKDADTKIVIMTGFATIDSAIEAIQYGVYDYIRKPFKYQEVQIILNRASEIICLKRKNVALNKKIQMMLSNITMLYDISTILYQVSDFTMVIEMILDTLAEGMKIEKAGIFLYDDSSDTFRIEKQIGLSDRFVEQFTFQSESNITNVKISSLETTTIFDIEKGIIIDGNSLEGNDRINQCVLAPVRYLGNLLGFVGVFKIQEGVFSKEDEIKLLNIMATQIAPIFQSAKQYHEKLRLSGNSYQLAISNIISEKIVYAEKMRNSVSFISLRLIYSFEAENIPTPENLSESYKKIVETEFESASEIIWQNVDSTLVVVFCGNPVTIEFSCANIRSKIEELFSDENNKPFLSVKYAIMTYPHDANSTERIVSGLNNALFN